MVKKVLVTFATPNFFFSRATLIRSATLFGIKNARSFSGTDFKKTSFYKDNLLITSQSRGAGYWLWKPYFILETLRSLNENDILIYCDAGADFIANPDPLIELVAKNEKGVLLFENYQGSGYFSQTQGMDVSEYNLYTELNKNKYWAKRDAFVLMGVDDECFWNSPQVNANFQLYRKTHQSLAFLEEWLMHCCNKQIITDSPNICGKPDFENLFSHIHDQAILSLVAKKNQIELFRCPSQFGNHYKLPKFRNEKEYLILPYSKTPKTNSEYGTIINHHRTRYMPFKFRLKSFLRQELNAITSRFNYVVP